MATNDKKSFSASSAVVQSNRGLLLVWITVLYLKTYWKKYHMAQQIY